MNSINKLGIFGGRPIALAGILTAMKSLLLLIRSGKKKHGKFWLFFSRTLIIALIFAALASPITQKETIIQGDPFVKILLDNSSSFSLYDSAAAGRVGEKLKEGMHVESKKIGDVERSALGDEILENMEE